MHVRRRNYDPELTSMPIMTTPETAVYTLHGIHKVSVKAIF